MANLHSNDILNMKSDYGVGLSEYICAKYNLSIHHYYPVPQISFTSRKAIIATNKGHFFLKEKPFYCKSDESLFRASSFQNFCSLKSNCFVPIINTRDNSFFINYKADIYFLTPYLPSRGFIGELEDYKKMIEALLVLKFLGKDYLNENIPNNSYLKPFKSYEIILPYTFILPMVSSGLDKKILQDLIKAIKFLQKKFDEINDIEYVMSHGDCILFNFQIDNEKAVLHDFDNAKVLPSVHDLAEFFVSSSLLNYCGEITNLKLPIFYKPHKRIANMIAKEIKDNLNSNEKRLIPICIEIIWLWSHMLAVIKEDYPITALENVAQTIFDRSLYRELVILFDE